jgi:4-alpha-glucanotransferase
MLVILPLQDWLSIDGDVRHSNPDEERINLPSNPRHYWRYRMHISLEELIANSTLNDKLKEMITQSGR